ncbi:restriction endonuclease subunit S [Flavobacterium branchiophilum]|uniref:Type I restriction enzyme S subunit n=1 Tax=Flavobacterium branchiophilum TaxID=55197 RepID=A0A543G482_9FLAO|nr:restriction endonuclease subunit S [Flavobacterium branchiophilum]TQM40913.1 type I restriction enzyme S subunit [Flavobacterium branchiophilum]GEM56612.1 type I restriction-modification system restriction endonuclease DNA specificity subunit HsdS [Flavobacterium branchiophilum NBRC 15030 = ATCC 35035]
MVETLKYASISIDEIIASKLRFEANVYNVEVRKAKEILKNCKWEIKFVADFIENCFYGGRGKRNYVKKSNSDDIIGFLGSSEMLELKPNPIKFFSKKTTNISQFSLEKGWLLISRSGTIGNVTLVNNSLEKHLVSEHAIRIIPKDYAGYLYAYFKSEVGISIVQSNIYGAVIKQIEPEHIVKISIPNPSKEIKEKIHNLIMNSFELRDQANALIDQAEKLLVDALKLPSFDTLQPNYYDTESEVKTFSVRLDLLNNRFDGSYHNPVVMNIIDCLFDAGATIKRLDDKEITSAIFQAGRFTRNYVENENGVVFLGGKQILELNPNDKKYLSKTTHKSRIEELLVKENMIAITRSGTIGKTQLIPKHWENWALSEHVLRVVPKDDTISGYLYIWLNSEFGKALIKKLTYGAVIDEIEAHHLAEIPIPILKQKEVMQEINDLALKANKLRAEAYYKEQEALQILNDEVIYATK